MADPSTLGLYVHWPFCQSKCPYCDFNSHVVARVDQERWAHALAAEIARVGAITKGRILTSVFFGGGTPSLMSAATVDHVMDAIRHTWSCANDIEVTLEANPGSVEADRFANYRMAGVNRVSMGIQALNNRDLKALGRLHTADEAMRAFDVARNVFDRVSFDLIYARQDQTLADWEVELQRALALAVDHLSLYQLTIEDGTAFGDRFAVGKLRGLPDEDRAADMWDVTHSITMAAGMPGYEISNHARKDAQSKHNLIYWRGDDYAAVGPGAHGRITLNGTRHATEAIPAPGLWLTSVENRGTGDSGLQPLASDERFAERVMMGLRLDEGVAMSVFDGQSDHFHRTINSLVELGMLEASDSALRTTPTGKPVLNAILRELLAG